MISAIALKLHCIALALLTSGFSVLPIRAKINPGPKWPGIFLAVKLPAIGSKFEFNKFSGFLGKLGFPMRHAFLEEPPTGRLLAHDLFQNVQFGQEVSLGVAHNFDPVKIREVRHPGRRNTADVHPRRSRK